MRVLHVIPSLSVRSGGPAQAIFPMCRSLIEQGIEVVIAATDHDLLSSGQKQSDEKRFQDVDTILFPAQFGDSYKYSRPFSQWLNENVDKFDVVHIHAVFNHSCLAAARACRKYRVPYIVRPLGTLSPWSMKQKSLKKSLFWKVSGQRMMQNAAAIHYTTHAEREATERSLGLNHGRVVPLGIDLNDFAPRNELDAGDRLPAAPYILVLSRLHPKKGLDVLLEAFLTVVAEPQFENWQLLLAGDGPETYVAALRDIVRNRDLDSKVSFLGWISGTRKSAILERAELLTLPSYDENFGLCVMEAMAAGVPVLVSPHVNLADEIIKSGAGWVVEVNKQKLAETLTEILSSPLERAERGKAGRLLASTFSWTAVAQRLNSIYMEVSS